MKTIDLDEHDVKEIEVEIEEGSQEQYFDRFSDEGFMTNEEKLLQ